MKQISFYFLEIRLRFFYVLLSIVFTLITISNYQLEMLYVIGRPFVNLNYKFIFIDLTEALSTILKIYGIVTLLFCIFYMIYQFWSFIIPSYYFSERKQLNMELLLILGLFILEILLIYFIILPNICNFLLSFEIQSNLIIIEFSARIQSYVNLTLRVFCLVLILFQIPILFIIIYKKTWLTSYDLCNNRKIFFFAVYY